MAACASGHVCRVTVTSTERIIVIKTDKGQLYRFLHWLATVEHEKLGLPTNTINENYEIERIVKIQFLKTPADAPTIFEAAKGAGNYENSAGAILLMDAQRVFDGVELAYKTICALDQQLNGDRNSRKDILVVLFDWQSTVKVASDTDEDPDQLFTLYNADFVTKMQLEFLNGLWSRQLPKESRVFFCISPFGSNNQFLDAHTIKYVCFLVGSIHDLNEVRNAIRRAGVDFDKKLRTLQLSQEKLERLQSDITDRLNRKSPHKSAKKQNKENRILKKMAAARSPKPQESPTKEEKKDEDLSEYQEGVARRYYEGVLLGSNIDGDTLKIFFEDLRKEAGNEDQNPLPPKLDEEKKEEKDEAEEEVVCPRKARKMRKIKHAEEMKRRAREQTAKQDAENAELQPTHTVDVPDLRFACGGHTTEIGRTDRTKKEDSSGTQDSSAGTDAMNEYLQQMTGASPSTSEKLSEETGRQTKPRTSSEFDIIENAKMMVRADILQLVMKQNDQKEDEEASQRARRHVDSAPMQGGNTANSQETGSECSQGSRSSRKKRRRQVKNRRKNADPGQKQGAADEHSFSLDSSAEVATGHENLLAPRHFLERSLEDKEYDPDDSFSTADNSRSLENLDSDASSPDKEGQKQEDLQKLREALGPVGEDWAAEFGEPAGGRGRFARTSSPKPSPERREQSRPEVYMASLADVLDALEEEEGIEKEMTRTRRNSSGS